MKTWHVIDISKSKYVGLIEFQKNNGEFEYFEIVATKDFVVFGGSTNNTFLQSGYIKREEGETLNETLTELLEDLEVYYNEGKKFCFRIVCNKRM